MQGAASVTWQMAPSMPVPLMSHPTVRLHDGRVLVLGGESVLGVPTRTTQLYDPSANIWSTPTRMHTARTGFTAIFDPRATRWSVLPALRPTRFSQTASLLVDGRVLFDWGIVSHAISRSTILIDPDDNAFTAGPATLFPQAQQCGSR
jgi:hypothetical protein